MIYIQYTCSKIAKGTTDPRAEFKFKHKSNFIFRILNKHQLQNLNQSSAFRLNSNIKILNKPSFTISTKIKFHNLNQASAAKYWPILSKGSQWSDLGPIKIPNSGQPAAPNCSPFWAVLCPSKRKKILPLKYWNFLLKTYFCYEQSGQIWSNKNEKVWKRLI